jgi:uncharacterized repeat protein (TIGR01451 family)
MTHRHHRTATRPRRALIGAAAGSAILALGLATGGSALAAPPGHDDPPPPTYTSEGGVTAQTIDGNISCASLGYAYGIKYSGTYNFTAPIALNPGGSPKAEHSTNSGLPGGQVPPLPGQTITVTSADGKLFDWTATVPVAAVIAKGGDSGNAYLYQGTDLDRGDDGLRAPNNNGGQMPALSHVDFCFAPVAVVKVTKKLVDGAGDASFQFTLAKDGTPVAGAFAPLGHGDSDSTTVEPGAPYSLSEVPPAAGSGYAFQSLTCEVTGPGTTTPAQITGATAAFTPGAFQTVHCTYTNLKLPTLTVIKDVVNDNGGTLGPEAFTMNVDAAEPSDASFPGASGEGTTITVKPGEYAVTETGDAGYAASYDEDCAGRIAAGDHITCTITNDDLAPRLTVIKNVTNDDGGTLKPADFRIKVTATNPSDASFPGASGEGTTVTLDAGEYSVDEEDPRGYTKTLGDGCSGSVGVGESRTCVITNDDVAGEITIIPETPQTPVTPVVPATPVTPQGIPTRTRPALARLAITKTGPRRARALQRFSYTIRVRNTGKVVARSVRMRDALPAGLIPVRTNIASTQRGRVVTVQLGNLRPGQVRTVRVTVRAAASIKGRKVNVAVARAANAAPVRDEARTVFAPVVRRVVPAVTG